MPVTAVRGEGTLRMWVCRLPVHIALRRMQLFYGNSRKIRNFSLGGQRRPPAGYIGFTDIFGETAASQRADVGIGPYMTPANSCCPANFECKAFLPQSFKGNYYQIWCIVTGGAYQIARRVSTCVRNICKSDSCLNRTAGCTPRPQAPLFSPFFSGKTEKNGPSETSPAHNPAKHLNHQEGTTRENSLFS